MCTILRELLGFENKQQHYEIQMIFSFLKDRQERAYLATENARSLKEKDVIIHNVMTTRRKFVRYGQAYAKGCNAESGIKAIKEYIITWIN